MLAIQDAFRLTLIVIVVAVIAAALIRTRRQSAAEARTGDERSALSVEEEAARAEARLGA